MTEENQYNRKIMTETLLLFDEVCKKLNIKYYLSHGTLLGAVKYKGYIPWDDDLDVMMTRDNYEKLKNHILSHPNNQYSLGAFECGFYSMDLIGKFFNRKYYCLEEGALLTHPWIDIYILSDAPEKGLSEYILRLKFALSVSRLFNRRIKYYNWYKKKINIIIYRLWHNRQIIKKDIINNFHRKILTEYRNKGENYLLMQPGVFDVFSKKWFEKDVYAEFEGYRFPVPDSYHLILKTMYGDYMNTLPPEKERHYTHNIIYLKPNEYFVASYSYFGEK